MLKIKSLSVLCLSILGTSFIRADDIVLIDNKTDMPFVGALVYVSLNGHISTPTEFFDIDPYSTTDQPMPAKSLTGKSRYLFVTSDTYMNPEKFKNLRLGSLNRISEYELGDIIAIGSGGLTGPAQNWVIVESVQGYKPMMFAKSW